MPLALLFLSVLPASGLGDSGICESDRDRLRGLPTERFGRARRRMWHIHWLILAKKPRELLWPFTRQHLREEVRQLSMLGGQGITIDRIHLSLDNL